MIQPAGSGGLALIKSGGILPDKAWKAADVAYAIEAGSVHPVTGITFCCKNFLTSTRALRLNGCKIFIVSGNSQR
jgi:hypothetical protein